MQSFNPSHQAFSGANDALSQTAGGYLNPQSNPSSLQKSEYQVLYTQFQVRYPAGALISELLHIHEGKFVVRALVQTGGATLSTGLAAAYTPEMAEDQARVRALEVLGIYPQLTSINLQHEAPPSNSTCEVQVRLTTNQPSDTLSAGVFASRDQAALQGSLLEDTIEIAQPVPRSPRLAAQHDQQVLTHPELDEFTTIESQPDASPRPSPAKAGNRRTNTEPSKTSRKTSTSVSVPAAEPLTLQHPLDLSDVIAQTSVEIKRLGWTEAQGRSYLQSTYGKRSRQQLTDDELLDFLQYLETQPMPQESPF
jgi:hypothetical protein